MLKHTIQRKLHSESGVSILLALVVLLVASFISVTLLSASSSSVKTSSKNQTSIQDNLTLDSACKLLKTTLNRQEYYAYASGELDNRQFSFSDQIGNNNPSFPGTWAISTAVINGSSSVTSDSFTISVEGINEIKDVTGNYAIVKTNDSEEDLYQAIYTLSLTAEDNTVLKRYVTFSVSVDTANFDPNKRVVMWTWNGVRGKESDRL